MERKDRFRARAQRFLTGPFDAHDLTTLFLYLREHFNGAETVRDVGHMIGHGDLRDRGLILDRLSDIYLMMKWHVQFNEREPLDFRDAPPEMFEMMSITFRNSSDDMLKTNLHMRRQQVVSALSKIKKKYVLINDRLRWNRPDFHKKEATILRFLNALVINHAYDAVTLHEETRELLIHHGFIDENQRDLFDERADWLAAYALVTMHGVELALPDNMIGKAYVGWSNYGGRPSLGLNADFPFHAKGKNFTISFRLFDTSLDPTAWVPDHAGRESADYDKPIELTPYGHIRVIGG